MSIIKYTLGGDYNELNSSEAIILNGPIDLLNQGTVSVVLQDDGYALTNDTSQSPLATDTPTSDQQLLNYSEDGIYVDFSDILGAVSLDGGDKGDVLLAGSGNDDLKGGGGNDILQGASGDDTLKGGGGSDILEGGLGTNDIQGGGGNDTVSYEHFDAPTEVEPGRWFGVNVDLSRGGSSDDQGLFLNDTLTGISNIRGSSYDDMLIGDDSNNVIEGGIGADSIYGGNGVDAISYAHSTQGVTVNLSLETASGGDAAGDEFYEMENVVGSTTDDNITGDNGANTLTGNGGTDILNGMGGNDRLVISSTPTDIDGGVDTDFLFVTGGGSVSLAEDTFAGIEAVYVRNDTRLDMSEVEKGAKIISQSTLGHGTEIIGTSGADRIVAGKGGDTLDGGKGGDKLFAGADADTFHFQAGFGRDNVYGFKAGTDDIFNLATDHIHIDIAGVDAFDLKLTSFHGGQDTIVTFEGIESINKIILHDVNVEEVRAAQNDLFTFGA